MQSEYPGETSLGWLFPHTGDVCGKRFVFENRFFQFFLHFATDALRPGRNVRKQRGNGAGGVRQGRAQQWWLRTATSGGRRSVLATKGGIVARASTAAALCGCGHPTLKATRRMACGNGAYGMGEGEGQDSRKAPWFVENRDGKCSAMLQCSSLREGTGRGSGWKDGTFRAQPRRPLLLKIRNTNEDALQTAACSCFGLPGRRIDGCQCW